MFALIAGIGLNGPALGQAKNSSRLVVAAAEIAELAAEREMMPQAVASPHKGRHQQYFLACLGH